MTLFHDMFVSLKAPRVRGISMQRASHPAGPYRLKKNLIYHTYTKKYKLDNIEFFNLNINVLNWLVCNYTTSKCEGCAERPRLLHRPHLKEDDLGGPKDCQTLPTS